MAACGGIASCISWPFLLPSLCPLCVQAFDPVTREWSQPQAHLQGSGRLRNSDNMNNKKPLWPHQPSPRGGHTCTSINGKLWVFGGYGGSGYSRRDLDDLYTLDPEKWVWAKAITKVRETMQGCCVYLNAHEIEGRHGRGH